jgi:hypothetical protein
MSNAGWFGWFDILDFSEALELELKRLVWIVGDSGLDSRSIEDGVLMGNAGRGSKCLEITDSLS